MATRQPPHPPARGIERALCWIVTVLVSVQFAFTVVAVFAWPDFELHWMYLVAPPIVILIGVGRLRGWVKRGTGFGFG